MGVKMARAVALQGRHEAPLTPAITAAARECALRKNSGKRKGGQKGAALGSLAWSNHSMFEQIRPGLARRPPSKAAKPILPMRLAGSRCYYQRRAANPIPRRTRSPTRNKAELGCCRIVRRGGLAPNRSFPGRRQRPAAREPSVLLVSAFSLSPDLGPWTAASSYLPQWQTSPCCHWPHSDASFESPADLLRQPPEVRPDGIWRT